MKKIFLPFVAVIVCLVTDSGSRAVGATTSSPIAVSPPGSIRSRSLVQTGNGVLRTANQARTLTFAERVNYQRAIEDIYWRHRIWPKERTDSKPPLEAVTSPRQIKEKVRDYLRNSRVLEDYWQRPISFQQLQAEMDRMAQHTKNPEMLHELFEAMGNDPFVIAECLARPALSERLVSQFHEMNPNPKSELEQAGEAWLQSQSAVGDSDTAADPPVSSGYSLPALTDTASACTDNTWSSLIDLPAHRANHTAVWTGSEMIVFGGLNYVKSVGTGDRYNPATDSWSKMRLTNAPVARNNHTAVWTGTEMIVWGGYNQIGSGAVYLNSGGKYNPANDTWTATGISNAPTARGDHTAIWTGTSMLVWGGSDATGLPNTGGRYDPITNSWQAITTTHAPRGRYQHSAVWTGTAMIIWGGRNCVDCYLNSGAKYNPASDTWSSTSTINAPGARFGHSAVWTGNEMIIWGGWNGTALGDGAKYDPATNAWIALSATNALEARYSHSAVWTGSEMIIWGGNVFNDPSAGNSGSRYNPTTNTWNPMSMIDAPSPRYANTTIWTGSEMIVFGGAYDETLNNGGRYDPAADTWTPVRTTNTPERRYQHTAVWTGSEMIVWGGSAAGGTANTGGRYDPALDMWTPTSTVNAPQARQAHTAVWTGMEMIVWGGWYSSSLNTGGRYNPATDSWTRTTLINAPSPRRWHTAIWTGREMIVWGGESRVDTGGRYNPATDSWITMTTTNAPVPRSSHTAVWTGTEMIVFGGGGGSATNTGGRYNPLTNSWVATSTNTQPRSAHTAVWTGSVMIVWGGYNGSVHVNTGARYNPSTNTWAATSLVNAPDGRSAHAAIWTGKEMIVWGGYSPQQDRFFNTGGRYNPTTDSWTATTTRNAPNAAEFPTAVWTGSQMIVWGGFFSGYDPFGHYIEYLLSAGGRYCAEAPAATPTPTPRPATLRNISTRAFVQTGDNVMIGGFIVQGTGPKRVIIRAIGPELSQFGVPNPLANPRLELHNAAGALIGSNDDWQHTIIGGVITASQLADIQNSDHAPTNPSESAIIADLPPGNYTAIVSGVSNMTGVALVEVYDLSANTASILGNISTRSFVQTGDNVMIGGFIVQGTGAKRVIVRATGSELGAPPYNIPNALANPTLELHNGAGALIASNDNWRTTIIGGVITGNQVGDITNSGYAPSDGRESAIIAELQPGNYTAIVRGVNDTMGVGLVEVYDLH